MRLETISVAEIGDLCEMALPVVAAVFFGICACDALIDREKTWKILATTVLSLAFSYIAYRRIRG
jgi:hypothetical protein